MEANTLIETKDGMVSIKELVPGVSQIHVGGEWRVVEHVISRGKKNCYKLVNTRGKELRLPVCHFIGTYATIEIDDAIAATDDIEWTSIGALGIMTDPIVVSTPTGFDLTQILSKTFIGMRECYTIKVKGDEQGFTANSYMAKEIG